MEAHLDRVATVRDLEEAVALIFQHNFDADSRVCLFTLMKMLDNLLHKPGDAKVRTIRLHNAAFHDKVGCRKGAIEFLVACGFERRQCSPAIMSSSTNGEEQLVLSPEKEEQSQLILARRLLMTRAIQDLGLTAEELPVYRPPPALTSSNTATTSTTAFNPYAGHRYDAKSAAVGANLGPDANYVSKTESQLQRLQEQQAALEAKLPAAIDRGWRASSPPKTAVTTAAAAVAATDPTSSKGDSSLLAERMQKHQQERLQREQGGFTTKAMRDLEKLKKQKVYSHVSLTIHFPDGTKLLGKFSPKETVETVKRSLVQDCFADAAEADQDFALYVTPPRRLLTEDSTLTAEGLVPAAKIFVSWKGAGPVGAYLRPTLFEGSDDNDSSYYPDSQAVAGGSSNENAAKEKKAAGEDDKKDDAAKREAALMRRMMGGGKLLGSKKKKNKAKK